MKLPPDASERIEAAVERAEERTSVEVVVTAVPFAGSYRDIEYQFGFACALAFLAFALFAESWHIPPGSVIPSLAICWLVGWALCRFSPHLRRLMTSAERRRRQARDAARLTFLEQGVDRTRARTGLLVQVSFLEGTAVLVADRGVTDVFGAAELERWGRDLYRALWSDRSLDAFCAKLVELGGALGERLPPGDENPDELANAPILDV